jgi:hypothetical protein
MVQAQALERALAQHHKSFGINILTSKSNALKVLQAIFAKPAPVKVFREVGTGGVPLQWKKFPPKVTPNIRNAWVHQDIFHGKYPQI